MYSEIDSSITSFASTVNASWNGVPQPVNFAAELTSASSALGEGLLSADRYAGALLELDSLKANGVKTINIQLAFPSYTGAITPRPPSISNMSIFTGGSPRISARGA